MIDTGTSAPHDPHLNAATIPVPHVTWSDQALLAFAKGRWATFGQRLGAHVLDIIILIVPSFIIAALAMALTTNVMVGLAAIPLTYIGYHTLLVVARQRASLGRCAFGLMVLDAREGAPLELPRSLQRAVLSSNLFQFAASGHPTRSH